MLKYLKIAKKFIANPLSYLYEGYRYHITLPYFKSLTYYLRRNCRNFYRDLHLSRSKDQEFMRLQKRVKGLHALFGKDLKYSYSILVKIENSSLNFLKESLLSCCHQTPINFEILVGASFQLSQDHLKVIEDIKNKHTNFVFYDFSDEDKNASLNNLLAQKASKKFLLFVDGGDFIRPDLLFRYEQCLRSVDCSQNLVVTSYENVMSEKGFTFPNSEKIKKAPIFPYVFQEAFPLRGVLIPTDLWNRVHGLRLEFKGVVAEDLYLRLDLEKASFSIIPIALYSRNVKQKEVPFSKHALKSSMEEYVLRKNLNWKFSLGEHPSYIKAIPEIEQAHKVHVIVPYKDLKELTLRSIELVLKQKNVSLAVTAVDNNSEDQSIASAIKEMGCEVISIDEPFNYSRLNNLAVDRSEVGKSCDLLLFLNNDVELDRDAIFEMVRWIDQPKIGAVGACLLYPNGSIQHGGIDFKPYQYEDTVHYGLVDYMQNLKTCDRSLSISIMDSVTGACLLVKKDLFLKIGGFNEIWYPVAYSDTELTQRIENSGLKCLYTPYAKGVHHESLSRKVVLEDVENSRWLHDLCVNQAKAKRSVRL